MSEPRIFHPTDRPNFTVVDVDGMTYWFSYETLVAFRRNGATHVRENVWGPTTGKHLNLIDGGDAYARAARLSHEDFDRIRLDITANV